MKLISSLVLIALALVVVPTVSGQQQSEYLSLRLEMERAIRKGNAFLATQQGKEGFWGEKETPALTALVLAAMVRDPGLDYTKPHPQHVEQGFDWLVQQQKDDGGIYVKGLATYNTSSAIMALLARDREEDRPIILKAREFLINQQTDWGNKGSADNKYDGGIGYGGTYAHSDLSNTYLAMEALYHSRQIAKDNNCLLYTSPSPRDRG